MSNAQVATTVRTAVQCSVVHQTVTPARRSCPSQQRCKGVVVSRYTLYGWRYTTSREAGSVHNGQPAWRMPTWYGIRRRVRQAGAWRSAAAASAATPTYSMAAGRCGGANAGAGGRGGKPSRGLSARSKPSAPLVKPGRDNSNKRITTESWLGVAYGDGCRYVAGTRQVACVPAGGKGGSCARARPRRR